MPKRKNFLICPLDWGLGHTTRLVPVIDLLLKQGARVVIGADNRPLAYLKTRFNNCDFISIPGFVPRYPENGSMALTMIKDFGKMKSAARRANALVQDIIEEMKIDVVISDNRYEIYGKDTYNVFITHQLNIQTPGFTKLFKPFIRYQLNHYIRKFDELWIPDFKGISNLSGQLSHVRNFPIDNSHFIGPLSRFALFNPSDKKLDIDVLVLLSGPEPQRSILEEKLTQQIKGTDFSTIILQGKPENDKDFKIDNIHILPHADDALFAQMVKSARIIVSRPGYSTLMDLAELEAKAAFIPTPGQTEQEYLAKKLKGEGIFYSESQKNFDIMMAVEAYDNYSGLKISSGNELLNQRIAALMG